MLSLSHSPLIDTHQAPKSSTVWLQGAPGFDTKADSVKKK